MVDMREKAIEYLQCPKCAGHFDSREEKIICGKCGFAVEIGNGIVFNFEKSEMPTKAIEKTMYGPELAELERELSNKEAARLAFLKCLDDQSPDAVCFDFGCGSSRQIFDLADQFPQGIVFGLDFDSEPLEIVAQVARKLGYKNIFLLQYRSADLPFRNDIFRVVTSHQVLEHVPAPGKSVCEISRVIKKEGVFEVDFPNGNSVGESLRNIFHKLTGTKNPHISRIGLKRAGKMFEAGGFRVEKARSVQIITGPLSYFIEGVFLRYIMKRRKLWETRKKYQRNFVFRALQKLERKPAKYFPRLGHAFEFILTKI